MPRIHGHCPKAESAAEEGVTGTTTGQFLVKRKVGTLVRTVRGVPWVPSPPALQHLWRRDVCLGRISLPPPAAARRATATLRQVLGRAVSGCPLGPGTGRHPCPANQQGGCSQQQPRQCHHHRLPSLCPGQPKRTGKLKKSWRKGYLPGIQLVCNDNDLRAAVVVALADAAHHVCHMPLDDAQT